MLRNDFIEAAILYQIKEDKTTLLKSFPESFANEKNEQFVRINLPEYTQKKSIFMFTVQNGVCYSLVFPYNEDCYTISVISKHQIPHLFCSFLNDSYKDFIKINDVSPENRFDYIYGVLNTWQICKPIVDEDGNNQYSFRTPVRNYVVDISYFTFQHYNPFFMFRDYESLRRAWKSLFISNCKETGIVDKNFGNGVLVVGKDRNELALCVYSVASLLHPFVYKGNILITTSLFDSRISSTEYDLVGILEGALPHIKRKFDVTLHVSKNNRGDFVIENEIKKVNRIIKTTLLYLMDFTLIENPFNDMEGGEYIDEHGKEHINGTNWSVLIDADDLRSSEKTKTLKAWRKLNIFRNTFREAFLSSEPEDILEKVKANEFDEIEGYLDKISNNYHDDVHVMSVVKNYKKIISEKV